MASQTPYTYIQCPCADPTLASTSANVPLSPNLSRGEEDDEDNTFDPRAPRSSYSLFPLDYLLYCEDCHQIRCSRCIIEEIVAYFCPNCLFEVPSSNLKSEGNRCTRSCFQCPICVGPLSVTAADPPTSSSHQHLNPDKPAGSSHPSQSGPYVLHCGYCSWSSSEIGIKFEKPSGIYNQLSKLENGGKLKPIRGKDHPHRPTPHLWSTSSGLGPPVSVTGASSDPGDNHENAGEKRLDSEAQFAALKSFYQNQLSESNGSSSITALTELGFSSPGSLSRIMSLYSGGGADKKSKNLKNSGMREVSTTQEGLKMSELDETAKIDRLRSSDWSNCSSTKQNTAATGGGAGAMPTLFASDLRPSAYLLRAKRSKRCPLCRHIISKPEAKITNTRFRIRLVAGSYIPSITIKPMSSLSAPPIPSSSQPFYPPETILSPLQPAQFLLTFHNPLFESVKVSLATPAVTPGRFQSKVTVLCPQFEINANTDVWDEALKDGSGRDRRSTRGGAGGGDDNHHHQAEAGKIWERGRNWVTIVLEVTPSSVRPEHLTTLGKEPDEVDTSPLKEDEDVLEIPMFVRLEWEVDVGHEDVGHELGRDKCDRDRRELAYCPSQIPTRSMRSRKSPAAAAKQRTWARSLNNKSKKAKSCGSEGAEGTGPSNEQGEVAKPGKNEKLDSGNTLEAPRNDVAKEQDQ
ncbi:putative dynactin arp1 p62 subunit ro2 protein [Zalerion maritima]|uniref:Dynactin subunit 4 n=1 Tax=Zalerion maritima TaxID=339359 RepID=A0AAD5RQE9_9PEZI|nr:putative dynactin arp1 p62 subunit ro2 protein [Zalerion maritima]